MNSNQSNLIIQAICKVLEMLPKSQLFHLIIKLICHVSYAQIPTSFKYQGVLHNGGEVSVDSLPKKTLNRFNLNHTKFILLLFIWLQCIFIKTNAQDPGNSNCQNCSYTADIILVIDESGSVGSEYVQEQDFVNRFVSNLAQFTNAENIHFSIITQSNPEVYLNWSTAAFSVQQAVIEIPLSNQGDKLDEALDLAISELAAKKTEGRDQYLFIFSEGTTNAANQITALNDLGVTTYAVGVESDEPDIENNLLQYTNALDRIFYSTTSDLEAQADEMANHFLDISCGCHAGNDSDGDGICDSIDNCVDISNPLQEDIDNNGIGDVCESVAIPDPNFEQALIDLGIDGDGVINQQILLSEAEAVTALNVAGKQIADLTGIEGFVNLTNLDCSNNLLAELTLENNTLLTSLNCHTNQLTALEVSANIELELLNCSKNMLTELDVVSLNQLGYLDCFDNAITYLELDHNPLLYHLRCSKNQLQDLILDNNPALHTLDFGQNQIAEMDLESNPELTQLFCKSNQLYDLILTGNPKLIKLECTDNNIDTLDLSNNPLLIQVICSLNELEVLDVTHLENLERLICSHNQITDLDLRNNKKLYQLECHNNELATLDLRNGANELITNLNAANNSSLTCISIDDELADHSGWTVDAGVILSNDCGYNTQRGDIVKVRPEEHLPSRVAIDVVFGSVNKSGHTSVEKTVGVVDPAGMSFPDNQEVYNLETTAEYEGDINLTFDYSELQYNNEDGLRLLHYHDNAWEDITTSVDTENDAIHGITSSLSPFVIYETATGEVITLLNSQGEGLAGGTVKYYAGGWHDVEGATDINGEIAINLPEDVIPTSWKMYYAGASAQKNNSEEPIVFQTVNVSMDLLSSTGEVLVSEDAKYYASGWKQFGDGITTASMELLPNNYPFKVYYKGGSNQKSQDVETDANVVFETGLVTMHLVSSAGSILISDDAKYYASGWKTFGDRHTTASMELLPNKYPFKVYFAGGLNQTSQQVNNGSEVEFATAEVSMSLQVDGIPQASTDARYYAGGWKTFDSGITEISMELLPNKYPFKVYYDGKIEQISQDIGVNQVVAFNISTSNARVAENTTIDKKKLFNKDNISIFPNPVQDVLVVEFNEESSKDIEGIDIHLFNMTGVDMIENHKENIKGNRMEIDVKYLPAGMYILVIPIGDQQFKHKLSKL